MERLMAALHLIFSPQGERESRHRRAPDDLVVLLQEGVLADVPGIVQLHVLADDAQARGITGRFSEVQLIDWDRFVHLTELASPVVSWP